MCLVISPFSSDLIKMKIDYFQTSQLSRFGRDTHSFKAILTVSHISRNFYTFGRHLQTLIEHSECIIRIEYKQR